MALQSVPPALTSSRSFTAPAVPSPASFRPSSLPSGLSPHPLPPLPSPFPAPPSLPPASPPLYLQVFIKPNKVVYLPTTFVEEEFEVTALPLDCELQVEADGVLAAETYRVSGSRR